LLGGSKDKVELFFSNTTKHLDVL